MIAFNGSLRVISQDDCSYAMGKYTVIAKMSMSAQAAAGKVENLIARVEDLANAAGYSHQPARGQGISEEEYKKYRNEIALPQCRMPAPRLTQKPTTHQLRELLDMCYYEQHYNFLAFSTGRISAERI